MSDPLIVPIELQALLVNDAVRTQTFNRASYDYAFMFRRYDSPEPGPFATDASFNTDTSSNGIHLHWSLPAALRRGVHSTTTGTTDFPLLPNRWLVVRYSGPGAARIATAWVVESDTLGDTAGSPYIDPSGAARTQVFTGKVVSLTSTWSEPNAQTPFLKAVAPGNLTFLAYQPNVKNVFSMHDPLDGVQPGESLSYLVIGWYSDPANDPLAGITSADAFLAKLEELGWSSTAAAETFTDRTLYSGLVLEIPWDDTNLPPRDAIPDPSTITMAIGNTSIEALTELIRRQSITIPNPPIDPDLLEAFQYDMLREYDAQSGLAELDDRIYDASFDAHPGDVSYEVVMRSGQENPPQPDWLYDLNRRQSEADALRREIANDQAALYLLWWKSVRAPILSRANGNNYPPGTSSQQFIDALGKDVPALQAKLDDLASRIADLPYGDTQFALQQSLDAYAAKMGLPADQMLKRGEGDRFFIANDLVLLFAGIRTPVEADLDADLLACRFPTQVVSAFRYDANQPPITASGLGSAIPLPPLTTFGELESPFTALVDELFLLSPSDADLISQTLGGTPSAATLRAAMSDRSNDVGDLPGLLPPLDWQQPWSPLFLAWELLYYPIDQSSWTFTRHGWTPIDNPVAATELRINGRIFLTPRANANFEDRLVKAMNDAASESEKQSLQNLLDFISQTDDWQFLSQTLDGFGDQLLLRNPMSQIAAEDPVAPLLGGGAMETAKIDLETPEVEFRPMRGGQFYFRDVRIIDRFGRALSLVSEDNKLFHTLFVPEALQTTPGKTVTQVRGDAVQVGPRVQQPARLRMELVAQDDDTKPLGKYDIDPICAWVLPNHIDQALACYTAKGEPLGEIRNVYDERNAQVVDFQLAGGSPFDSLDAIRAALPQFYDFYAGLQTAGPTAFTDLLNVIDATLWQHDPLGGRDDAYLSVLIGRPLALLRASIALELYGTPLPDPRWEATFTDQSHPPLLDIDFPVLLGDESRDDDGLLGYFMGTDYSRFNAVRVPADVTSSYIAKISETNDLSLRFNGAARILTLFVDPRASVHAVTQLLPVGTLSVPPALATQALANMAVSFRVGPILTTLQTPSTSDTTNVQRIVMPRPAQKDGTWSFAENGNSVPLAPSDGTATFPNAPVLRSGSLELDTKGTA